jgi:hypothetical protein
LQPIQDKGSDRAAKSKDADVRTMAHQTTRRGDQRCGVFKLGCQLLEVGL